MGTQWSPAQSRIASDKRAHVMREIVETLLFVGLVFLIVFTALLYLTKKRVWHAVLHDHELEKPRAPTEYKV